MKELVQNIDNIPKNTKNERSIKFYLCDQLNYDLELKMDKELRQNAYKNRTI